MHRAVQLVTDKGPAEQCRLLGVSTQASDVEPILSIMKDDFSGRNRGAGAEICAPEGNRQEVF
jgi:hypothetical protein